MSTVQERPSTNGTHVSRRALLAASTLGLCGAAVAAPYAAPIIGQHLEDAALDAGLGELRQLEGVSLDAAIRAAEITRAAVSVIVLPLARFLAALGSGALGLLLGALDAARGALTLVHLPTTTLDQFRDVVASWQSGAGALPIALDDYLTADISSAEAYLKALRRRMAQQPAIGQEGRPSV